MKKEIETIIYLSKKLPQLDLPLLYSILFYLDLVSYKEHELPFISSTYFLFPQGAISLEVKTKMDYLINQTLDKKDEINNQDFKDYLENLILIKIRNEWKIIGKKTDFQFNLLNKGDKNFIDMVLTRIMKKIGISELKKLNQKDIMQLIQTEEIIKHKSVFEPIILSDANIINI